MSGYGNTLFLKRVAFCTPVVYTLHSLVGTVAQVSGASMQPTLNPTAAELKSSLSWLDRIFPDYVFINKLAARRCSYSRGDVVTLWSPENENVTNKNSANPCCCRCWEPQALTGSGGRAGHADQARDRGAGRLGSVSQPCSGPSPPVQVERRANS